MKLIRNSFPMTVHGHFSLKSANTTTVYQFILQGGHWHPQQTPGFATERTHY